ncbi:MAG: HipA domain-containing protein [Chthonomonadales bacterium]
MTTQSQRIIEVWADWAPTGPPVLLGNLTASPLRGKEVFSFEYDPEWVKNGGVKDLDPELRLFSGPQYPSAGRSNFGAFLDSAPDRWGRMLMDRREAQLARDGGQPRRSLRESDYLLGVFDEHRMGALRFRTDPDGPFLDDNREFASPPWTSLRELEHASLEIERQGSEQVPDYRKWLRMLIAPGGSLGGARPKAGVVDPDGHLWIAKFPSRGDTIDGGLWELLIHQLAERAGITVSEAQARTFNTKRHTFLTKRFDRSASGGRIHFASAMTVTGRTDGDDASTGASYLELAEFLIRQGAHPERDLEQLWRRIVFNICVSNADDHLRNHGFLLEPNGWVLSPAYDMNPDPYSDGLKLNISDIDNAQDLSLARDVAGFFRVEEPRARAIIAEVVAVVREWRPLAKTLRIASEEIERMEQAFRVAEAGT